jgi:pimeloyl-ACP methyl ester carboxylesterase
MLMSHPSESVVPHNLGALILPGSGSDHFFVRAAFEEPLRAVGIALHAPPPVPGTGLVEGYLKALDAAIERKTPLLVGGVSLGALVAAKWAASRGLLDQGAVVGLMLVLPPWTGAPGDAPAAIAARTSADALERHGLTATLEAVEHTSPRWLADELTRAWSRYGEGLADSLRVAASTEGPTEAQLAHLAVPVAVVGLADDPVHPLSIAERWADLAPCARLVTSTLPALGQDPAVLGRAAALAWLRASQSARCRPRR